MSTNTQIVSKEDCPDPHQGKVSDRAGDWLVGPQGAATMIDASVSTIYRWIETGHLPPPIKIGPDEQRGMVRWWYITLREWIDNRA